MASRPATTLLQQTFDTQRLKRCGVDPIDDLGGRLQISHRCAPRVCVKNTCQTHLAVEVPNSAANEKHQRFSSNNVRHVMMSACERSRSPALWVPLRPPLVQTTWLVGAGPPQGLVRPQEGLLTLLQAFACPFGFWTLPPWVLFLERFDLVAHPAAERSPKTLELLAFALLFAVGPTIFLRP